MCLTVMLIHSCKEAEIKPDYTIVQGQLSNTKGGPLVFSDLSGFSKTINIKENGVFLDTLHVNEGFFMAMLGENVMPMYFTKGAVIEITADAKDVSNTLTYTGDNKDLNNYYAYKAKRTSKIREDMATNLALEENDYLKLINEVKVDLPGGSLKIRWQGQDSALRMTGAAEHIFDGYINL